MKRELRIVKHKPYLLIFNTVVALVCAAVPYYLMYFRPVRNIFYLSEDSWVEDGTFFSWMLAACFLTIGVLKFRLPNKVGYVILALACFAVAMEEISWGQRLLHFQTPEMIHQLNRQGEATLHNMVPGHYQKIVVVAIFVWSTILSLISRKSIIIERICMKLEIPVVAMRLIPYFVVGCLFKFNHTVTMGSEWSELYIGVAFAIFGLDILISMRKSEDNARQLGRVFVAPLVFLSLLSIVTGANQYLRNYDYGEKAAYLIPVFTSYYYPERGLYEQTAKVYEFVFNHPELIKEDTYIRYGELLSWMGKSDASKKILEQALEDQNKLRVSAQNDVNARRNAGIILALLGRDPESQSCRRS